MGRIDAYASWRHYLDHLAPVWLALSPAIRGRLYGPPEVQAWARRRGAPQELRSVHFAGGFPDRKSRIPVLVAGFKDHHEVKPRPTVIINHGAGQTYRGDRYAKGHEAYAGGPGRERALLHLEPGSLAGRQAETAGYRYEMIGSPRLDPWHGDNRPKVFSADVTPLVAVAFHHDPQGCAEQRSAIEHYVPLLPTLVEQLGDRLIGHGHPRSWGRTSTMWGRLGVRVEPDFARVLDEAMVLVTDSSSVGVEFASTGRPVIWCSAPWYRRNIDHGGRFWDWPMHSLHIDGPDELLAMIGTALSWPACLAERQWPMVDDVFAYRDGKAAQRAAGAILSVLADR